MAAVLLLAQLVPPPVEFIAYGVAFLIGLLTIISLVLAIHAKLFPSREGKEAFVTMEQLNGHLERITEVMEKLDKRLDSFNQRMETMVPRLEWDKEMIRMAAQLEKYQQYIHQRHHDFAGHLQTLMNGQAQMNAKFDLALNAFPKPHKP